MRTYILNCLTTTAEIKRQRVVNPTIPCTIHLEYHEKSWQHFKGDLIKLESSEDELTGTHVDQKPWGCLTQKRKKKSWENDYQTF